MGARISSRRPRNSNRKSTANPEIICNDLIFIAGVFSVNIEQDSQSIKKAIELFEFGQYKDLHSTICPGASTEHFRFELRHHGKELQPYEVKILKFLPPLIYY